MVQRANNPNPAGEDPIDGIFQSGFGSKLWSCQQLFNKLNGVPNSDLQLFKLNRDQLYHLLDKLPPLVVSELKLAAIQCTDEWCGAIAYQFRVQLTSGGQPLPGFVDPESDEHETGRIGIEIGLDVRQLIGTVGPWWGMPQGGDFTAEQFDRMPGELSRSLLNKAEYVTPGGTRCTGIAELLKQLTHESPPGPLQDLDQELFEQEFLSLDTPVDELKRDLLKDADRVLEQHYAFLLANLIAPPDPSAGGALQDWRTLLSEAEASNTLAQPTVRMQIARAACELCRADPAFSSLRGDELVTAVQELVEDRKAGREEILERLRKVLPSGSDIFVHSVNRIRGDTLLLEILTENRFALAKFFA